MKLVCLNVFGGKLYEQLIKFLQHQRKTTDIFCFQEILIKKSKMEFTSELRPNFLQELKHSLPEFRDFFITAHENFGQAIFVKNDSNVKYYGSEIVYAGKKVVETPAYDLPRVVQYCEVNDFWVFNFHGFATWPKIDTPERISQSENLVKVLNNFKGKKILCGDFNVWMETKTIQLIEREMKNLIRDLDIKTTRNPGLSPDDKISDYIFVSPDIKVRNFSVPNILVSDHLPLILEFDL